MLDGDTEVLGPEDLRFSTADIARYFDLTLSRRELARVVSQSRGWAIALRAALDHEKAARWDEKRVLREVTVNWVGSQLLRGLPDDDLELILDVSLFELFDAELLDDVLGQSGALKRLDAIRALAGLLEYDSGAGKLGFRLHPIVRAHCAERRRVETPKRYREVHLRLAGVLLRRGQTLQAMRSVAVAGDAEAVGRALVKAGGVRLWLREGVGLLLHVDRLLTVETMRVSPRLPLVRCAALALRGRLREARAAYEDAVSASRAESPDPDLEVDCAIARALLSYDGCEPAPPDQTEALTAEIARFEEQPGLDPVTRAAMAFWLCLRHAMHAEFAAAAQHAERAYRLAGRESRYLAMMLNYQTGTMAMARGDVQLAAGLYRQGLRAARRLPQVASSHELIGEVLKAELMLERSGIGDADAAARLCRKVLLEGLPYAPTAAAVDAAACLALAAGDSIRAARVVEEARERAQDLGALSLERLLSAMQVSVLAEDGRLEEAEQTWLVAGLPDSDDGCLDLEAQDWRQMEAVTCARVRLLALRGDDDAARRLAAGLKRSASECGLRRTVMRALALAMAIECAAGAADAAAAHLRAFLELFRETDYARGVTREGPAVAPAVERFLCDHPDSPLVPAAERLLQGAAPTQARARLTRREHDVLRLAKTLSDKEIGAELDLSRDGVRYHLNNAFRKLKVHSRQDAVRRAREQGIL